MRGGAVAARRAHNPKVAGSNPAPAIKTGTFECLFCFNYSGIRVRARNPQVVGSNPILAAFLRTIARKDMVLFNSNNYG